MHMSKKFLSLLLVFCMLLPLVPTMALPVFAAGEKAVAVAYRYADAANANFTRDTTSKLADYTTADGVDIDGYKAWLESSDAYAIKQNDPNWKVGAIDTATATLSPFTRVSFFTGVTGGASTNTSWALTEAGYQALLPAYLNSYNTESKSWSAFYADIWGGYPLQGEQGKADQASYPSWCGLTHSGGGSTGMQFTATVAGEYTLGLDHYNDLSTHTLTILKKSGDTVTTLLPATAKASAVSAVAALGAIELAVGDTVSFVVTGKNNPCYIKPVVNLLSDEVITYKYTSATANFARTTNSEAVCAEAFKGEDSMLSAAELAAYKVWLMHPDTFAITQNDPNWKVGSFDPSTAALSPFTRIDAFEGLEPDGKHTNTQWSLTESGYRAHVEKLISTYDAANNKWTGNSVWYGYNTMGQFTNANIANGMGWCGMTINTNAMQFTATVAGTYTLSSELFMEGKDASHTFSIVVKRDGKVETLLADTAISAMTAEKVEAVGAIDLDTGDTVSFVVKNAGNPCYIKPVVTLVKKANVATYRYSDSYAYNAWTKSGITYDANLSKEENLANLTAPGVWAITQNNAMWKVGQYDLTNGSLEPFARVAFYQDASWAVTEKAYQSMVTNYVNSEGATQSVWGGYALMGQARYDGITSSASDKNWGSIHVAMQFTVPQDGKYLPSITSLEEKGRHYVALMVDNEKVWPAGDSWYCIAQGTKSTADINNALASIGVLELEAGQVVSLVFKRTEWGGSYLNPLHITPVMTWLASDMVAVTQNAASQSISSFYKPGDKITLSAISGSIGWDENGDGCIDYLNGATYTVPEQDVVLTAIEPFKTVFKPNSTHPTWDGSQMVFHGNWSIGHIVKATGVYAPVAYRDGNFLKVNSNGPWLSGGVGTGVALYHSRADRMVFTGAVVDNPIYYPLIRYTAPYTGTVSLSYDMLWAIREVNPNTDPAGIISQGYAIYVNNEKVWPTDGDWYWYNSETVYDVAVNKTVDVLAILKQENGGSFAITLDVTEGDIIDFRTIQGNKATYHTQQQPTVTYTSVTEDYYTSDYPNASNQSQFQYGYGKSVQVDKTTGKVLLPAGWQLISRPASEYGTPDNVTVMDTLINHSSGAAYVPNDTFNTDSWIVSADMVGKSIVHDGSGVPMFGFYGKDRNDYWGSTGEVISRNNYAAGYQYTASVTGYVDISIDQLKARNATAYAALFVDGVMVWPTKGGSYTTLGDWYSFAAHKQTTNVYEQYETKLGDTSGLSNVYVEAGDKIEMLFIKGWAGNGTSASLTVKEYAFATDFVKAVVDGTSRQILDVVYAGQDATALYSRVDTYVGWDVDGDGVADLANGGTIKNVTENTIITAIRADTSRFDQNLPFVYENRTFTYDESNTDWSIGKADWNVDFTVDTETKLTLGTEVTKLDTQYNPTTPILYDGTPGISMYDKMNGGGIYNDRKWVIRLPVSQKAVGAFYTAPYSGVVDLDYSVIKGHWELNANDAHFFVTVDDTKYYAYYNTTSDTEATFIYVQADKRAIYSIKLSTDAESGLTQYYTYTDTNEDGTPDAMVLTDVTEATQGVKNEVYQQVYAGVYLAIVHNGEVIWPSNGVPFLYKSDAPNSRFNQTQGDTTALAKARAYEAFPTNLRVEAGDTIAFVANTDHSLNNMVWMDPVVTYTQVYEQVDAYVSVDVTDKFAVNLESGAADVRASESGIEVTGNVDKILAKDMADLITFRTYQVINGEKVYFAEKTTSLSAILAYYATQPEGVSVELAKTADALYHYGFAAANYFDGDELPVVTDTMLQNVVVDDSEEAKKISATLEEGVTRNYKILGATLMLEDELKMVFLIQTADGSAMDKTGLSLLVADANGHQKALIGAEAFTLPAEGGNGSQMLVAFSVPVSQYQEKQYVTVLDNGVKVSETVAYSVMTYIARQYEGGEGKADNVLRAIANVSSPVSTFEAGLVEASDTNTFKYCGTWEPVGDTMVSHWNESYVEVDFYGTSVTPVFSQSSTFLYSIDGGSYTQVTANGEYTITTQGEGKHTLRIKTTNRTNNVYFAGVQVESQYQIHRADSKAHYIHFVGDSISDSPVSFSRRVGDVLGWDYATTAVSGMALETDYGYWRNNNGWDPSTGSYTEGSMAQLIYQNSGHTNVGMEDAFFTYGYPTKDMTGDLKTKYAGYYNADGTVNDDFKIDYTDMAYKPDIVFIFLGTNDDGTTKEKFGETYVKFVDDIKAAYGDEIDIWVLQSLCTPTAARFENINYAVELLTAKYGDDIHFIDWAEISTWGLTFSDHVHPDETGYAITVEKISAILDAHYNTEA